LTIRVGHDDRSSRVDAQQVVGVGILEVDAEESSHREQASLIGRHLCPVAAGAGRRRAESHVEAGVGDDEMAVGTARTARRRWRQ
jgi:hypothetical protein